METNILPQIDLEALQQKANEYAQKGAEDCLKEFYTGYNSPYKKAIEENLKTKGVDGEFDLPDIIAVLNDKLSQEIDFIANNAIAQTFVPLVKAFLTREDAEVKFSDILKEFISHSKYEYDDDLHWEDYRCELEKDYDDPGSALKDTWFKYRIENSKIGFEVRFYRNKHKNDLVTVMSLPYMKNASGRYYDKNENTTMKLSLEGGASLEMPFTRGILENDFMRFCARLVIGNNSIVFDCQDFEEDMFPSRGHCHCD